MIAEFLTSKSDQLAFIKTCRAFQDAGYRMLYADVVIQGFSPEFDPLLVTLYHRPELAKYIRSYSGPQLIRIFEEDRVWKKIKELGSQPLDAPEGWFPIILEHAKGIRELEIFAFHNGTFGEQTKNLICQMPLKKLIIHDWVKTMPLTKLLRAHPGIRHLELRINRSKYDFLSLTGEDLPNLEFLAAPANEVKSLVPGRPIRSVGMDFCTERDLWTNLSLSSAEVKELDLSPGVPYQRMEVVAPYLTKIRRLRLRSHRFLIEEASKAPVQWHDKELIVRFCTLSQVFKAVGYFPELERLDFGEVFEPQIGPHGPIGFARSSCKGIYGDRDAWDSPLDRLFVTSKTLTKVNMAGYKAFHVIRTTAFTKWILVLIRNRDRKVISWRVKALDLKT